MWESDPVLCMGPPVGATGAVAVQMIGSLFFWWAARSAVTAAPPPDGPRERAPRFLLSSTVTSWGDYKKEPATFLRHGEYHCVIGERQLPVLNSYLELQSRFADCAVWKSINSVTGPAPCKQMYAIKAAIDRRASLEVRGRCRN